MSSYVCTVCNALISLCHVQCSCPQGVPDLRAKTLQTWNHDSLYQRIGQDDKVSSFQPMAEKEERAQEDLWKLRRILRSERRLRILEVGPGDGCLARELSNSHDVFVIDITDEYIKNLDYVKGSFIGDIENMPFRNEFDVVILCDVLEHVLNEGDALLSTWASLRSDGYLYVRCPANEPLITYAQQLGSAYPYVHLRTYTKSLLARSVRSAGFQVLHCGYSRSGAAGFARRTFGLQILKKSRSIRHTNDVYCAYNSLPSTKPIGPIDWLFTKLEALTWIVGRIVFRKTAEFWLQRIWYRPSEVFILAKKLKLDFPFDEFAKSMDGESL